MKQRGKFNKKFNKRKGTPKNNKAKFNKTRKKYNLNDQKQTQQFGKRKPKVLKEREETPPMQVEAVAEEESSSESDEGSDHLTQLVSTFGSKTQKQGAIDSSDDDTSDEDDMEVSQVEQSQETAAKSDDSETSDHDDAEEAELEVEPEKNTKDPFEKHFLFDLHENFANDLKNNTAACALEQEIWTGIGKFSVQIPKNSNAAAEKEEVSLLETKVYATCGKPPQKINSSKVSLSDVHIKTQIVGNIAKANESWKEAENASMPVTPLQTELFSLVNNYQDLYFPYRNFGNAEEIRFVYSLHAINHVLKTRTKVLHHNARLSNKDDIPEEFRDQGLVRPKVLIIVPFRDSAYRIIQNLICILLPDDKGNVINKLRFLEEFTGGELIMPKKNPKPEDYELLFAGNSSDDFKIGITVTKKSLKLYADFYSSDIIIASPLGLRYIIGAEGEPDRDFDFLASIELLILDQTEVFLMQNWDHLLHVFNHLHLQPKSLHGTDFSRVRTWSLNGWAKFYRQTLLFSSVMLPEINSIFNKRCCNYAGKVKVLNPVTSGTIGQVYVQLPHVFYKFSSNSANEVVDARFDFFTGKLLAQHQDTLMKQTLIYVSNYFDYVRLRNYFKKNDLSFVQICEYTKESKIARARDMFYHGDAHFMLYTDRFHFYHRKRVKGIRHLIFYQLPIMPHFYYEMCNLMQEGNMNKKVGTMSNMTVSVLYSKYDVQQLAAVVGTEKATKMVTSDKNVHMLLTG